MSNLNLTRLVAAREIQASLCKRLERTHHVTPELISRIGLEYELEGHHGCVNCLQWNDNGNLLASGSDDCQIILWDAFRHKKKIALKTGHTGNIFSVKFLPNSNDLTIVSGAADRQIHVHDLKTGETTHVFSCHAGRVKRIAVAPNLPFMFWSASEDGIIMQHDLRCPELSAGSNPKNVLINLTAHMGIHAEAKCLAINPMRPEMMAVGANDPYVRLYDTRMLTCKNTSISSSSSPVRSMDTGDDVTPSSLSKSEKYAMPHHSVKYLVAGHLPAKQNDFRKKYRTLASTYLTFSPSGNELLVNLGGEQIYLFDVNKFKQPKKFDMPASHHRNGLKKDPISSSNGYTNGYNLSHTNGVNLHSLGISSMNDTSSTGHFAKREGSEEKEILPVIVETLKDKANSMFEQQNYPLAVTYYNKAISLAPHVATLYGNRSAAYMKRKWDGDTYAALRDCYMTIGLNPKHFKAHFRMAKCLFELLWTQEAEECLTHFKLWFPEHGLSKACKALDKDIKAAIYSKTEKEKETESDDNNSSNKKPQISDQEKMWQSEAGDYDYRFCGHCNTTTDIKEANFFGSNGQYIVAGSDDGSFFIWERKTTNIVRVLRGDDSIVNCLQPHPSYCCLATSGIDPVVRLWSPRPDDGSKEEREVDNCDDAASANQTRMNADPVEVMLMNMGYRITSSMDRDDDDGSGESPVTCRTS